jgi:hypothetical protein
MASDTRPDREPDSDRMPTHHHPGLHGISVDPPTLPGAIHELAGELAGFRSEVRSLRESVRDLRDQVSDLRRQSTAKDEQVIILRTQHRVLWAVAGIAGTSGLGALVLEILRVIKVTP